MIKVVSTSSPVPGMRERIIRRCNQLGITPRALSEATGLSRSAVSRILTGAAKSVSVETGVAIARALDCSVEVLVTGRERPPRKGKR